MVDFKVEFNVLEKDPDYSSVAPLSGILSPVLSNLTQENICAPLSGILSPVLLNLTQENICDICAISSLNTT